jgi:hypothetical protein
MEKLPIVICIDVEPEERAINPRVAADWVGFEKTFEFFEELRPQLQDATGSPVHFSWGVRMDPQIAHVYGNPAWAVARYGRLFDRLAASGDDIGLHVHPWRWDEGFGEWIADMGNQEWVDSCVRMGFEAFEESLHRPCLSFRFGDRWINHATVGLVERLGARYELTIEPGRTTLLVPEAHTGCAPDFSLAPRLPYHPSKTNFIESSDSSSRSFWALPLTTFNPDQVWRSLSAKGKEYRQPSFFEKLRKGASRDNDYEGFLDRSDYEAIGGWAYDARQPDRPLDIEIYDGKVMLARICADGFRFDLRREGKGSGRHSFILPTPSSLRDGKAHSIRARVANTKFDLRGSPRPIMADHPPFTELGVLLLDLSAEPWLASRIMDVALSAPGKRYLATSIRTEEILIDHRHANLSETCAGFLKHPLVKDFVFETPAELVARIE